ncbi:MAG: OmpH family outer membrane protein [Muribaculaceae bacterium]|nr:OmpH family outer membrane protein [Muribaculaceae bacterium]
MIKKILLAIAIALPMLASAQTVKLGLVDVNEIIGAMPATQAAQQKLQDAQKKYESDYNALQEELKKQYEELANMKEDELPAIRQRKETAFQESSQKLQVFEQQIMQDMQRMQQELMAPIMQQIKNAIESVGKEGNYTLIQDNNPQITYYYSSPAEDITPLVKTKLGL